MCRSWQESGCPEQEMSNADWEDVIKQLHQLLPSDRKVIFSGSGEALLREGVEELLCLAASKFKVGLNSNGYLIDEPMARLIARNVEAISISLDGTTPTKPTTISGETRGL
jgi:Predicted Fe-S oxidoreductases